MVVVCGVEFVGEGDGCGLGSNGGEFGVGGEAPCVVPSWFDVVSSVVFSIWWLYPGVDGGYGAALFCCC